MRREHTFSWSDPQELAGAAATTDGLDFLTRTTTGELPHPPLSASTGIVPVEFGDGWAVFEMEPAE